MRRWWRELKWRRCLCSTCDIGAERARDEMRRILRVAVLGFVISKFGVPSRGSRTARVVREMLGILKLLRSCSVLSCSVCSRVLALWRQRICARAEQDAPECFTATCLA